MAPSKEALKTLEHHLTILAERLKMQNQISRQMEAAVDGKIPLFVVKSRIYQILPFGGFTGFGRRSARKVESSLHSERAPALASDQNVVNSDPT
ncbi:hypothetical protein KFK09_012642 [Dendrobium nobile]|uniref:Uncharacterized protein n=1 Tax=Dendrobium nobile TaxID=94219 RepID=A0A8T3BLE3_DENNO|nr:hypothetical protein KFK09_012642 [Dendrobium nobile]